MPIVRIRQHKTVCEAVVVGHETIWHGRAHQLPRSCQRVKRDIWSIRRDVSKALVKNLITPAGANNAGERDAKEQVTNRSWVEYARIVDDDERHAR